MAKSDPIPELGGRTWEELEVSRHTNGRLMFADELRTRDERGVVQVVTKIRVCVPQPEDEIEARVRAAALFAHKKLDRKLDAKLFDEVEQLCLLARAIRTYDEPHSQLKDAEELARYDEGSLQDIQERINVYKAIQDPRDSDVSDDKFWRTVLVVGRTGNLLPLTDIGGREQHSFVLRMAREALLSPKGRSFAPSSETSTPAPSH